MVNFVKNGSVKRRSDYGVESEMQEMDFMQMDTCKIK
jgi:hypothetical protein